MSPAYTNTQSRWLLQKKFEQRLHLKVSNSFLNTGFKKVVLWHEPHRFRIKKVAFSHGISKPAMLSQSL